jgi:mono/diheme cytochrome c family protein
MKRVLRWVLTGCVLLLLVAIGSIAYVYLASSRLLAKTYTINNVPLVSVRSDAASLQRGKYLAERVALCVECHGEDMGGKIAADGFAMGRLAAPNLTRGQGGLGPAYSDQDFVRAILHGVKKDGRSVTLMPSNDYRFTEEDLGALLGYLRSLPPVDRVMPTKSVGPMARILGLFTDFPLAAAARIDHASVRLAVPANEADPVAKGAYLVSTAACQGCHGTDFTGGGGPPPGAANITPVGIGDWNEQQFLTAIREHKRPNGSTIDEAMPRWYGQMSDADLRAIFAYLRTVPPGGEKTASQEKRD